MAVRVSFVTGRADKSGKHNDRNFATEKAGHIDRTRTDENRYWLYGDKEFTHTELQQAGITLEKQEQQFYKDTFAEHLAYQRRRNKENHHRERNAKTTIDNYRKNARSRPEDVILQLGNIKEMIGSDELWKIAKEYREAFEEAYGSHCKIVNMSLHVDEATPHVHMRRVWISDDEIGNKMVAQEKALNALGIERPDIERASGRFNNAKMTFTRAERDLFRGICANHGVELEPDGSRLLSEEEKAFGKHLPIREYKLRKREEGMKHHIDRIARFMSENPTFKGAYKEVIAEAKEKSNDEYVDTVMNLFDQEMAIMASVHSKSQELLIRSLVKAEEEKTKKELLEILRRHTSKETFAKIKAEFDAERISKSKTKETDKHEKTEPKKRRTEEGSEV